MDRNDGTIGQMKEDFCEGDTGSTSNRIEVKEEEQTKKIVSRMTDIIDGLNERLDEGVKRLATEVEKNASLERIIEKTDKEYSNLQIKFQDSVVAYQKTIDDIRNDRSNLSMELTRYKAMINEMAKDQILKIANAINEADWIGKFIKDENKSNFDIMIDAFDHYLVFSNNFVRHSNEKESNFRENFKKQEEVNRKLSERLENFKNQEEVNQKLSDHLENLKKELLYSNRSIVRLKKRCAKYKAELGIQNGGIDGIVAGAIEALKVITSSENTKDAKAIEDGKAALEWMRRQALEFWPDLPKGESPLYLARIIEGQIQKLSDELDHTATLLKEYAEKDHQRALEAQDKLTMAQAEYYEKRAGKIVNPNQPSQKPSRLQHVDEAIENHKNSEAEKAYEHSNADVWRRRIGEFMGLMDRVNDFGITPEEAERVVSLLAPTMVNNFFEKYKDLLKRQGDVKAATEDKPIETPAETQEPVDNRKEAPLEEEKKELLEKWAKMIFDDADKALEDESQFPKVEIERLDFNDSSYNTRTTKWMARDIYRQAEEEGAEVYRVPVAFIDLAVMPFSVNDADDFIFQMQRVLDTDLSIPIVFGPAGRVVDGWHRIIKAIIFGHRTIKAYKLKAMPEKYLELIPTKE